jgi:hypothetical protein
VAEQLPTSNLVSPSAKSSSNSGFGVSLEGSWVFAATSTLGHLHLQGTDENGAQLEGNNEGGEDDVGAGGGAQLEGDHHGRGGALGSSERVRCVFLDLCVLGLSLLQILYCPHIDQFLIVNGHIHVYHHLTVVTFNYRVADGRYYPERQRLTLPLQPGQSRPTPVDAT